MASNKELPHNKFIPLLKKLDAVSPEIQYSPPDQPNKVVSVNEVIRDIMKTNKSGYTLEVWSAQIEGMQYNPVQRILDGGLPRLIAFAKKPNSPKILKIQIKYNKPTDSAYIDAMDRFGSH